MGRKRKKSSQPLGACATSLVAPAGVNQETLSTVKRNCPSFDIASNYDAHGVSSSSCDTTRLIDVNVGVVGDGGFKSLNTSTDVFHSLLSTTHVPSCPPLDEPPCLDGCVSSNGGLLHAASNNKQHELFTPTNNIVDVVSPTNFLVDVGIEQDVNCDFTTSDMHIRVSPHILPSAMGVLQEPGSSCRGSPVLKVPLEPNVLRIVPPCLLCEAKRFEHETKGFCCSNGSVKLAIYDSPSELYDLFTSTSEENQFGDKYMLILSFNGHVPCRCPSP